MITFSTVFKKFGQKGDKTRWTYIDIPDDVTNALKPDQRTTFRVKGTLDSHPIQLVALLPMKRENGLGTGFIMPINATMRRGLDKAEEGKLIRVTLAVDNDPLPQSADLLSCLDDDPEAKQHFDSLAQSHQRYFSNWIEEAKTPTTREDRIAKAIRGLSMGMNFGEMIRYFKRQS